MNEKLLVPVSLLIAGLLIGGGLYFASNPKEVSKNTETKKEEVKSIKKVDPLIENISGSKDAEIFIVEYSDLECRFCKKYHDEVHLKLKEKYKENPKVAFVFRHFPLSSIHPSSFGQAIGLECAGIVGNSEKFSEYKNEIFKITKSDGKFDNTKLSEIAISIGLDKTSFEACLKNKEVADIVKASQDEAFAAGLRGSPTIFAQLKNGETFPVPADFETIDSSLSAYLETFQRNN